MVAKRLSGVAEMSQPKQYQAWVKAELIVTFTDDQVAGIEDQALRAASEAMERLEGVESYEVVGKITEVN